MKEIRPDWAVNHLFLGMGHALAGRWQEVRREIAEHDRQFAETYSLFTPFRDELEIRLFLEEGNPRSARAVAEVSEAYFLRNPNAAYSLVGYHAFEGRPEEAFHWRERLREVRAHPFRWIRVDPLLSALDGDPRFERIPR